MLNYIFDSSNSTMTKSNNQISSNIDFQSSQSKNTSHIFTYLTNPPHKKQRLEQILETRNKGGCEYQKTGQVNFSNFSVPQVFLKSSSTHKKQNPSSKHDHNESKTKIQEKQEKEYEKSHHAYERRTEFVLPKVDECSESASSNNSEVRISEKRKCIERDSSSFACSLEASNDPNIGFREYEDNYDSSYFSDDEEETPKNMVKLKVAREGNKIKSRNAKNHNLCERKRRDKINEKIRTLKELIPNCNKMDKASMLDDAIDYLKTLKLQLEIIMSMSRGVCMPLPINHHLMMLQMGHNHHMNMNMNMNAQQHDLMGFRPQQFHIPQMSNGDNNNNRVYNQMFSFSNQLPIPNVPFMPMIGNSCSTIPTSFGNQNQP